MKVALVKVRFTNSYAFRSGEWADVIGIVLVRPENLEPRLCYHLRFPDGVCDYSPINEPHDLMPIGEI